MLTCFHVVGFSPPDDPLRNWLLARKVERLENWQKFRQFIHSLLTVTKERLERIESKLFGELFCSCSKSNAHC
jgi:hypothetical protein